MRRREEKKGVKVVCECMEGGARVYGRRCAFLLLRA